MREVIHEVDARRLLSGGPVVLVTTAWRGNYNVMPAIYVTPLSVDPPLIGLAVHPERHTHDMIRASEEFALNVPTRELLHHCQYFGSASGGEMDKLELTKLPTFRARKVEAPLLEGCVGYVECGVEDAITTGDHTFFVGRVVSAQVERDAFDETWLLTDPDLKPLHYLGRNHYGLLEQRLEARVPQTEGEEASEEQAEEGRADVATELREQLERLAEQTERGNGEDGRARHS